MNQLHNLCQASFGFVWTLRNLHTRTSGIVFPLMNGLRNDIASFKEQYMYFYSAYVYRHGIKFLS